VKTRDDENSGFFSIFSGLDKFINIVSEAVEHDKKEVSISGDIGSGPEKKIAGKYGINIKLGPEAFSGVEKIKNFDEFFNRKDDLPKTTEPVTDIFEEEDGVTIVAELPGVSENEIMLRLNENIVTVAAEGRGISYLKKIKLKFTPNPDTLIESFSNSIYSVYIKKGA
jgi:HSP20 family protein